MLLNLAATTKPIPIQSTITVRTVPRESDRVGFDKLSFLGQRASQPPKILRSGLVVGLRSANRSLTELLGRSSTPGLPSPLESPSYDWARTNILRALAQLGPVRVRQRALTRLASDPHEERQRETEKKQKGADFMPPNVSDLEGQYGILTVTNKENFPLLPGET